MEKYIYSKKYQSRVKAIFQKIMLYCRSLKIQHLLLNKKSRHKNYDNIITKNNCGWHYPHT